MPQGRRSTLRALSPDELNWLAANHRQLSAQQMSRHLQVSDYAVMKLLIQHGLRDPAHLAPKYNPSLRPNLWRRPCLRCKCDAPRPRNLYLCDPCRSRSEEI